MKKVQFTKQEIQVLINYLTFLTDCTKSKEDLKNIEELINKLK